MKKIIRTISNSIIAITILALMMTVVNADIEKNTEVTQYQLDNEYGNVLNPLDGYSGFDVSYYGNIGYNYPFEEEGLMQPLVLQFNSEEQVVTEEYYVASNWFFRLPFIAFEKDEVEYYQDERGRRYKVEYGDDGQEHLSNYPSNCVLTKISENENIIYVLEMPYIKYFFNSSGALIKSVNLMKEEIQYDYLNGTLAAIDYGNDRIFLIHYNNDMIQFNYCIEGKECAKASAKIRTVQGKNLIKTIEDNDAAIVFEYNRDIVNNSCYLSSVEKAGLFRSVLTYNMLSPKKIQTISTLSEDGFQNLKTYTYYHNGLLHHETIEDAYDSEYEYNIQRENSLEIRLAKRSKELVTTEVFRYRNDGNLIQYGNNNNNLNITYNENGEVIKETENGECFFISYDDKGRIEKVVYPDGKTVYQKHLDQVSYYGEKSENKSKRQIIGT